MLANGDTVEDLLSEYPFLTREDVMAPSITPPAWPRSRSRIRKTIAKRARQDAKGIILGLLSRDAASGTRAS
jgi:hypothetical protein